MSKDSIHTFASRALTNILVRKLVGKTNPLGLMLHGLPIDYGMFELLNNGLMDCITLVSYQRGRGHGGWDTDKVFYRASAFPKHNRCAVIRSLAFRLGVDTP